MNRNFSFGSSNRSSSRLGNENGNMKLIIGAVVALIAIIVGVMVARNGSQNTTDTASTPPAASDSAGDPSGLKIEDLKVGTGTEATPGKLVSVHYTGWLTNGNKFDSSVDRGQPFQFPLGQGHVIRGWDEGVRGMKIGGKRRLTIPPDMAYGPEGRPPVIPPSSTLIFEVELLGVEG